MVTKLERSFLLFCSLQDKQSRGLRPQVMEILQQLMNKYKHVIIQHNNEVYEFTRFGDSVFIVYRYENSRFVYQSRLKVRYGNE